MVVSTKIIDIIVLNCYMEIIIDWISSSTKNKILAFYFIAGIIWIPNEIRERIDFLFKDK